MIKSTRAPQFSKTMRKGIEHVRSMLSHDFQWPVAVHFASDVNRRTNLATFRMDVLPMGAEGVVEPFGAIYCQATPDGVRYGVEDAKGVTVAQGLTAPSALQLARYLCSSAGPRLFNSDGQRMVATEAERQAHGLGRAEDDDADGFSESLRNSLDDIRRDVSRSIGYPVGLAYGAADEPTEQWAAFVLDVAPWGPYAVISVFIGKRVAGFAAIVGPDRRGALMHVESESEFKDDPEIHRLILDTVAANFEYLARPKRPTDHTLIALASGSPVQ